MLTSHYAPLHCPSRGTVPPRAILILPSSSNPPLAKGERVKQKRHRKVAAIELFKGEYGHLGSLREAGLASLPFFLSFFLFEKTVSTWGSANVNNPRGSLYGAQPTLGPREGPLLTCPSLVLSLKWARMMMEGRGDESLRARCQGKRSPCLSRGEVDCACLKVTSPSFTVGIPVGPSVAFKPLELFL